MDYTVLIRDYLLGNLDDDTHSHFEQMLQRDKKLLNVTLLQKLIVKNYDEIIEDELYAKLFEPDKSYEEHMSAIMKGSGERVDEIVLSPTNEFNCIDDDLEFKFKSPLESPLALTIENNQQEVKFEIEIPAGEQQFSIDVSYFSIGRFYWTLEPIEATDEREPVIRSFVIGKGWEARI